ncbi:TonB-dependent receptor [Roseateles asaccharophilus]|uniref:TonB-dependent receptor n=1 Tax=Roseateles asaccharophilus TaxID=582607 RepID=A0ABU2A3F5_9BURK|nr:TonB-dependent receptor [Roseateles asaccharophilus]MDR7331696.1 TonB-dependent receptor [Roseateles asaccharophilus]
MTQSSLFAPRRDRVGAAVSLALALMAHEAALAQTPAAPAAAASAPVAAAAAATKPAEAKPKAPVNELETVLVVGTRQSQQSAINRKKNSATAQDSIVAEDVGAFPDRNVGEAISRIAGVALDRGDYGEGVSVSIRGNGAELTRVELDGMGVSSGAGTNLLGRGAEGGDGRGTEFRELSSDLIKSVDVIKGSTAAMTEGSLGGGIIIQTRTGLDFDKPYYSFKAEATQSDLIKKTTPNFNLVLADKFLDKRLGVITNLNYSRYKNEMHSITQGGSNNQQGLVRMADFDGSPEKTFTFNPSTLWGDTINTPMLASGLTGGGFFNSATPTELLTKSAAAKTKADCFTAFPNLTAAETASIASANRTNAYTQRQNEQITCLNQWNDYSPSHTAGFRYNLRGQDDERKSGDIRLDFKVNNNLTIYSKLSAAKRHVDDTVGFLGVGSAPLFNPAGTFVDNTTTNVRTLNPASTAVASLLPNSYSWRANNAPLVQGTTTSILPGYTVDANHHVTSYSTNNGFYGTDTIFSTIDTDSKTLIAGGAYVNGRLKADFMGGFSKSTAMRYDRRASFSYNYGVGNFTLQDNGFWAFTLPNGSQNDQLNFPAYATLNPAVASAAFNASAVNPVTVPAYTAAQRAQYTNNTLLQVIRSFDSENSEKNGKLDLAYNLVDKVPFLTSLKGGVQYRDTRGDFWTGAGGTIKEPVGTYGQAGFVPGVYMPQVNTRWNVIGCENTAGSLAAGGQPCAQNGYMPNNQLNSGIGGVAAGTTTLTRAQYEELVRQTMTLAPAGQFYSGAKDRPDSLLNGWNQLDIDKLFALAGVPVRLDCFRSCTASDGKVYDKPVSRFSEKVQAAYVMTDFEIDRLPFTDRPLPFGLELSGNFGVRVVKTDVEGTGYMTFRSNRINPASYNPLDPYNAAGLLVYSQTSNVSIKDSNTDVMPSLNLALWPIADKLVMRYSVGKTVARPPVSKLLPEGTCNMYEFIDSAPTEDDGSEPDQGCGRFGNPALKPQTNVNHNLSAEWYPNRDTMFSLAYYRQRGLIGAPTLITSRNDVKLFKDSNAVDPFTGKSLADTEFSHTTWDNQPAATRRGFEFSMKTAFTFLPSFLRYTGFDANFTKAKSTQSLPTRELISGDVLPVAGEPKHSWNASLWYDDGAFQARVAMQVVAARYWAYSPNTTTNVGVFNYPSVGTAWRSGITSYNPGTPIFGNRTAFVDAKMSYKFKSGLELFADVRNLTGERTMSTTGGYQDYADGIPNIYGDSYNGRRFTVGFIIRSPR